MRNISTHTGRLSRFLVRELSQLRHENGMLACLIYGHYYKKDFNINPEKICGQKEEQNHSSSTTRSISNWLDPPKWIKNCERKAEDGVEDGVEDGDDEELYQGPIISFNLLSSDGKFVPYSNVETLSILHNIHLRTGCFCNPGACQYFLDLTSEEMKWNSSVGLICWEKTNILNKKPTGAVRVSLPYFATFEDVAKFLEFVKNNFLRSSLSSSFSRSQSLPSTTSSSSPPPPPPLSTKTSSSPPPPLSTETPSSSPSPTKKSPSSSPVP
eukprot:TRINITY_DN7505_c1_g1_i1.p1 TRINITY_DN7505_c1_g1~~TRINITY_DN7505_c1_g1_i1.p1  ORF type:complete len:269 (+),score=74.50 TRINITY_DN7505_c1_g1_i1:384-1190(+)